ncbi:MAG: tRNA 2-thiouridine(34) synthase MnmA [Tidjanibacter sp.]|nr:tRNA 2-thiouridine(34) synthase MnmA [Tidjanibacter sp.]
MEKKRERVVVGLSGGVDSSVAAQRLKEQGYDVVGLFMVNWHDTVGTLSGECPWEDDRLFAELVAKRLDIPFRMVDLSEQYRQRVVDYMFAEYEKGRTPNPDVLCNREIKFDVFLKEALKLGADWVATGHYCRVEHGEDGSHRLLAGTDKNKDQSYFLCQLSEEQLSRALFPVGDMLKSEVRAVAAEHHLATAKRKDSQGICFVGKVDLPVFLQQKLAARKGRIVEIDAAWEGYRTREQDAELFEREDLTTLAAPYTYAPSDGRKVGTHSGAHFYTIGQRHGLGVGGTALPLFVIATDVVRNIVYVGQGHQHPGLLRSALHIRPEEMHWVRESQRMRAGDEPRAYMVRIRYRQPLQSARLFVTEEGGYLLFDEPQRGITAGQFAAWYDGDELVGSGVIDE